MPSCVRLNPSASTDPSPNWNFLALNTTPSLAHSCRKGNACFRKDSIVSDYMTVSSIQRTQAFDEVLSFPIGFTNSSGCSS